MALSGDRGKLGEREVRRRQRSDRTDDDGDLGRIGGVNGGGQTENRCEAQCGQRSTKQA